MRAELAETGGATVKPSRHLQSCWPGPVCQWCVSNSSRPSLFVCATARGTTVIQAACWWQRCSDGLITQHMSIIPFLLLIHSTQEIVQDPRAHLSMALHDTPSPCTNQFESQHSERTSKQALVALVRERWLVWRSEESVNSKECDRITLSTRAGESGGAWGGV